MASPFGLMGPRTFFTGPSAPVRHTLARGTNPGWRLEAPLKPPETPLKLQGLGPATLTSSSVRSAAIQPYLVPPAEARSARTRVAVFLPDGLDGAMIASWMTMSRDIDLIRNASARRGVDVVISALAPGPDGNLMPQDMPYRAARLIVVGPPADDERLVDAAKNGAWAYCSLDSPPQELAATVRQVHAGECPLLAEISRRPGAANTTLALLAGGGGAPALPNRLPSPLTKREKEILIAVSDGATSREIAEKLGLTDQTVRNYMTTLLRKIGARTRGQAAAVALRNGWLDG